MVWFLASSAYGMERTSRWILRLVFMLWGNSQDSWTQCRACKNQIRDTLKETHPEIHAWFLEAGEMDLLSRVKNVSADRANFKRRPKKKRESPPPFVSEALNMNAMLSISGQSTAAYSHPPLQLPILCSFSPSTVFLD